MFNERDLYFARAQAATMLMGATADNIEVFNHRQYLRVDSAALDKELRSVSLGFAGRIPGRAADTLTPVTQRMFLRANCVSCYKDTCTAELPF